MHTLFEVALSLPLSFKLTQGCHTATYHPNGLPEEVFSAYRKGRVSPFCLPFFLPEKCREIQENIREKNRHPSRFCNMIYFFPLLLRLPCLSPPSSQLIHIVLHGTALCLVKSLLAVLIWTPAKFCPIKFSEDSSVRYKGHGSLHYRPEDQHDLNTKLWNDRPGKLL